MKRAMPWSDEEDDSSEEESSSLSGSESDCADGKTKKAKDRSKPEKSSKTKSSEGKSAKKKTSAMNFEALKQHGYKGGLSVLGVPLPKEEIKQDWYWSTGKESREKDVVEESYEERQKTREALAKGEELVGAQTRKDKKASFSQKEKRKRDLGQASRGKSYVEEEKRLLRDSGIYSGFDS